MAPLSLILLALACLPSAPLAKIVRSGSGAPKVTVKNGTYVGFHDPVLNTDNFYSVAYAQPPLEELRFRQPQSLNSSWLGDRVAVDYPKQCITTGMLSPYSVLGYQTRSREKRF
jgi:carboxylesterase type B